jgi:hypothetical protein
MMENTSVFESLRGLIVQRSSHGYDAARFCRGVLRKGKRIGRKKVACNFETAKKSAHDPQAAAYVKSLAAGWKRGRVFLMIFIRLQLVRRETAQIINAQTERGLYQSFQGWVWKTPYIRRSQPI